MKFCLIGEKLSHSYSCDIHKMFNLDYSLCELPKEKIGEFVSKREYDGFNITIPYKKEIIKYLDYVDEDALNIDSVNTVAYKNNQACGYNTDILGLYYLLEKNNISLCNKVVCILGSGGAGRTAEYIAKKQGAYDVIIVSRNGDVNYNNYKDKLFNVQVLINATPVGMYPNVNDSLIELGHFNRLECVIDLVYNPLRSNLILSAEKQNIYNVNGLDMLIYQALMSESIWLKKDFSFRETSDAISKILLSKLNVVLVGMPSCGKTTIGKMVAERLKKDFFDIDGEFEKENKIGTSEYIINYGEESFRKKESEIIESLSRRTGIVIATGGGSILREQNIINLKHNGIIIYIERDIDKLIDDNRPISKDKGIESLYNERREKYEMVKDEKVINNSSKEKCVEEIINIYENTCNQWR